MLNLNELRVFLAAAERRNFSKAGLDLHLSQPAVSQKIENLEKHLGTQLFDRSGRSARLTDAGQALAPMARELLAQAHRLEESMAGLQGEVVGEMNIGCSTASGKYLLPGLIARYRRVHPRVRVNVLISSRETVLNRLLAGELALGVSSKMIEHRDLEYQEFFTDDICLIVPAGHSWVGCEPIHPVDLLDEPMILREEAAGTREVLMSALRQHEISPDMLKVSMVLGNAEAIVLAVTEGLGVAFVSRLAANREFQAETVREVTVSGMNLQRKIYMVRSRRSPSSRSQLAFWDFVRGEAAAIDLRANQSQFVMNTTKPRIG